MSHDGEFDKTVVLRKVTVTEGKCPRCGNWHVLRGDWMMPQHLGRTYYHGGFRTEKCFGAGMRPELTRKRKIKALVAFDNDEETP